MKKIILISGGSGLIGTVLRKKLLSQGHEVRILSRNPSEVEGGNAYRWDVHRRIIDPKALEGVTHIVHLAGAGIADKRWTDQRKVEIVSSRVDSAALLLQGVKDSGSAPDAFISASGINYYGMQTTEEIHVETDPPSDDFIGHCCVKWEAAADTFASLARVVKLRTGVVLSAKGGALDRVAKPIKLGVGAPLGTGGQYMPYIHIDDLAEMYSHAISNPQMAGAYNACNGDHITNALLTKELAEVLNKPLWLPNIPEFAIKLVFGEMAGIILRGSRASAEKIRDTGFRFRFNDIKSTLEDLFGKTL